MSLFADPSTNVAIALFEPGYAEQYLGFDSKNQMYLESGMDDLVTPPTDTKSKCLVIYQYPHYPLAN